MGRPYTQPLGAASSWSQAAGWRSNFGDDCYDIVENLRRLQKERERQEVIAQLQELIENNERRRSKLRFIRRRSRSCPACCRR